MVAEFLLAPRLVPSQLFNDVQTPLSAILDGCGFVFVTIFVSSASCFPLEIKVKPRGTGLILSVKDEKN